MDAAELVVPAHIAVLGINESYLVHLLHCQSKKKRYDQSTEFQRVCDDLHQVRLQYFGDKVF